MVVHQGILLAAVGTAAGFRSAFALAIVLKSLFGVIPVTRMTFRAVVSQEVLQYRIVSQIQFTSDWPCNWHGVGES